MASPYTERGKALKRHAERMKEARWRLAWAGHPRDCSWCRNVDDYNPETTNVICWKCRFCSVHCACREDNALMHQN